MANITRVGEGKVVLISGGGKIYTDIAARFCKSQRSLDEILASDYDKRIVQNILSSGHLAATEFDYFLFGVEGYSRVTETQLVRKRMASYLISSGRTETGGKRKFDVVLPKEDDKWKETYGEIMLDSSTMIQLNYLQILELLESWYENAVAHGMPEEDARYMKPQATMFKAIIGMSGHGLLDWFKIRCCCYDNETEVLTNHGWKYFKDLNSSDLFYSIDINTMNCEFVRAKRFINDSYNGEMIKINSQSIDLLVTPNHNLLVSYQYNDKRYDIRKKFLLEEASDVLFHKLVSMKKNCNPIEGIKTDTFVIPEITVIDRNQYSPLTKTIESKIVNIHDFAKFLGFYISDGCCVKAGYHYNIIIGKGDFSIIQKYYVILSKITDNKVSIKVDTKNRKSPCYLLIVHDRRLYNYLINLGKTHEKHIPQEFFKYDYTILLSLLEGLIDGDGCFNKQNNSYNFTTTSPQLRDDFQRLALHIGFSSSSTECNRINQPGGIINGRQIINKNISYTLSLNRKKNSPIIKNITRDPFTIESYNGNIYCVELEKNHTLYVRRHGKCVWSGNSNAQTEIRDLANKMLKLCKQAAPDLFAKAGASCVSLGYCPEKWQCEKFKGKIPTHQDVLEMIHHWK